MREGRFVYKVFGAILLCSIALLLNNCGGGDGNGVGDGDGGDKGPSLATINQQTSQQVVGITILGQEIAVVGTEISDYDTSTQSTRETQSLNIASRVLNITKNKVPLFNGVIRIAGNESGQLMCSDSGSASYTLSWEGPNEPQYCGDVNNLIFNLTFYNCQEGTSNMNGSVSITYSGDLCSPPSTFILHYSNLSLSDQSEELYFNSSYFQLAYTEVTRVGMSITHMRVTADGDISANYQGDDYSVNYNNFFLIFDTNDNINYGITLGGSLTGGCLDGWITLETIEPILLNLYQDCPIGGKIRIIGNGDMIVQFYNDGSVDIGSIHYSSCEELDKACPAY